MNQRIVGYLVHRAGCIEGDPGLDYDYIFSGDGIYIAAKSPLLTACIPAVNCEIRGLTPTESKVELLHGKIPQAFFDLSLNTLLTNRHMETYLATTWNNGYHLFKTNQESLEMSVNYQRLENTILETHSHPGNIGPIFSGQDDEDEKGFRLSMVIALLDEMPILSIRVGVYGYHYPLFWTDVFEGTLTGAKDSLVMMTEPEVPPDVRKSENDVHSDTGLIRAPSLDLLSRGWWDRFISR